MPDHQIGINNTPDPEKNILSMFTEIDSWNQKKSRKISYGKREKRLFLNAFAVKSHVKSKATTGVCELSCDVTLYFKCSVKV